MHSSALQVLPHGIVLTLLHGHAVSALLVAAAALHELSMIRSRGKHAGAGVACLEGGALSAEDQVRDELLPVAGALAQLAQPSEGHVRALCIIGGHYGQRSGQPLFSLASIHGDTCSTIAYSMGTFLIFSIMEMFDISRP